MIEPELVQAHLRMDDDEFTLESDYLAHLIDAAVSAFELFTNRSLFAVGDALPDPVENALHINTAILQGCLLMIGHWYANRESVVVATSGAEIPITTNRLWAPYRWRRF